MTASSVALVLLLAACTSREDGVFATAPTHARDGSSTAATRGGGLAREGDGAHARARGKVDPVVKGVPHGGQIVEVAVTEQGDAALTVDALGGARLWPALDGSRTPVPVSLVAVQQLALVHAGDDLLGAALDEAGSIDLVRLGRDGSERGRVQLPGVGYHQIAALEDGVLARTDDHAIEWFTSAGGSRGKLVAEPSRHIQAVATRRGRAVALLSDGAKHELRWLDTVGGKLTWGPSLALPVGSPEGLIALSPSHRRLAVVDATATATVYDLGIAAVRVGSTAPAQGAKVIGFIDDDRVAIMGSSLQWWVMPPTAAARDPWAVPSTSMPITVNGHLDEGGAVADGFAITGYGAGLALTDKERARFLAYRQHGAGSVGVGATSLWVSMSGSHVMWLDDRLALAREIELRKDTTAPWLHATPIGDRHVVTQAPADGKYVVALVDVAKPDAPVVLGTYQSVERVDLSPQAGLLAVSVNGAVRRFQLDLATNAVRELSPIKRTGSLSAVRLLDPARAGGLIAITTGWDRDYDDDQTLTFHRANGKRTKMKAAGLALIDIEADGTFYTWNGEGIQVWRDNKKLSKVDVKNIAAPVAVAPGGARFAIRQGNDVVVIDRAGVEQWRKPIWGTAQLVFTRDGKHLAVRAAGGIAMLAAESGERLALECGWSFGLSTTAPVSNPPGVSSVCEDPML